MGIFFGYEIKEPFMVKVVDTDSFTNSPSYNVGDFVYITRIDSDGLVATNDLGTWGALGKNYIKIRSEDIEEEVKWIAWNLSHVSSPATSEEEAKQIAEEIVDVYPEEPVYIAKASSMVRQEGKVWTPVKGG